MKILLIDTCGATGSVALADTARSPALVASASLPGRTAAERFVPTIKALMVSSGIGLQSGVSLQSLDAVVVMHGPGSFTGVRVGLSAAKGLCQALNLPLVAISRLAVLASLAEPPAARVHALLDADRGEFYLGLYADGLCLREALVTRDQLLAEASREEQQSFVVCEPVVAEPTAADALPLALLRIQQRAFDDVATIDANYLRRTDAEIFAKPVAAAAPQPHATQPGTPAR